ncbi:MAG: anthranilate synthase component I family protein [Candidatus Omnitrophica bacterium]|nr:anthranilate synthase component I family protein [Candidatus Omnitrophota bacterium]
MINRFKPLLWKSVLPITTLKHWFGKGFVVPLVKEISYSGDLWGIFKNRKPASYSFFLDSRGRPPRLPVTSGRPQGVAPTNADVSYFGDSPFLVFRKKKNLMQVKIEKHQKNLHGNFLKTLRMLFRQYQGKSWEQFPFFTGGAVGYFGYGLAWEFEKLPHLSKNDLQLDDVVLLFVKDLFVFDHLRNHLYLISNLIPKLNSSFEGALEKAKQWIQESEKEVRQKPQETNGKVAIRNFRADIKKNTFKQIVKQAKQFIEAGDIYQANLSQRFSFQFSGNPEALYSALRKINPSPFASFLKLGRTIVVSASPERLVKKVGSHCEARPIAGTRPRGKTAEENQKRRQQLIASPKEQAEHIMLVDLARNDLGRVCKPRTVRVSEMMILEEYSHVIHIVSNVVGEIRKDCDQFDLLKAMFPGGTITGCPKIRSMEIIEELEPFARSLYTGSIGYLGFNGDMDLNIVIRTIVLNRDKGYLQVGAGIVYDSNPESEYWETIYKGKALLEALSHSKS